MYDVDGNGWIDLVEMTKIVRSIYKMMGPNQALVDQFETPEKRAEDIFRRMDANSDGRVTRQEFVRSCLNDSKLAELLSPRWIIITNKTIFSQLPSFSGCDENIPDTTYCSTIPAPVLGKLCNLQLNMPPCQIGHNSFSHYILPIVKIGSYSSCENLF